MNLPKLDMLKLWRFGPSCRGISRRLSWRLFRRMIEGKVDGLAENRAKAAKGLKMSSFVRGPVRAGSHILAGLIQIIYAFEKCERHAKGFSYYGHWSQ